MGLWDRIVVLARGRTVAVLGPQAVGKTTLHHFLRDGVHPGDPYRPTVGTRRVEQGRPEVADNGDHHKIAIRKGLDVPGDSKNNADDWGQLVRDSDVLLYLFDATKILAHDEEQLQRIRGDSDFISEMLLRRSQERHS